MPARSYLIILPVAAELAEAYLDGYALGSRMDRSAILAWLPCIAAARLTEGLAEQDAFLHGLAGG